MNVSLPKTLLDSLPAPDSDGLVQVKAALRMSSDGKAEIVEINGTPVPVGDDDQNPMPAEDTPDLMQAESDIYRS